MTPLTDAQRELVADPRHLRFARKVAEHVAARVGGRVRDDLHASALYGLVMAARTFDPSRGSSFTTHAYRRILGACQDCLREMRPRGFRKAGRRTGPIPELVPATRSVVSDDLPVGWELESLDELDALTAGLPPRERDVVRLYFGNAFKAPLKEIGKRFGYSEAWASGAFAKARARLADHSPGGERP